ncbi:hypothetical protein KEM56_004623, partial [Ascosphaera pollenicola]
MRSTSTRERAYHDDADHDHDHDHYDERDRKMNPTRTDDKPTAASTAADSQQPLHDDTSKQDDGHDKPADADADTHTHSPDHANDSSSSSSPPSEEEEITRCVCGSQDYPGLPGIYRELLSKGELPGHPAIQLPPPSSSHSLRRSAASKAERDSRRQNANANAAAAAPAAASANDDDDVDAEDPPDPGSLFIQCDACKVWQHGGCVGIMDEEASPEEYFCERCRGDLHRIVIDGKG